MEKPQGAPNEEAAQSFFQREERMLNDIAGGSGFRFKRGKGWAIMPETGEATYDPKFFEEKGYTPSQALFGAFHEIKSHLVETADILSTPEGEKEYQRFKRRSRDKQRIHIWDNCRTDTKGNRAIQQFAPALKGDMETLYKEKLFPQSDLRTIKDEQTGEERHMPRHLQFSYAVLRESMVPGEPVDVDPEVREAIQKLRNIEGKDVIELATDPMQDPTLALKLSARFIEPIIEKLYEEDLKDKQEQDSDGEGEEGEESEGEPGEGKGKPQKGKDKKGEPDESAFSDDYEDYEKRHPEPMDDEDTEKKIKETKKAQSEEARQDKAYEQEHGVSKADVANYHQEYRHAEPVIDPLREIFNRIVEQRKIPIRRLTPLKEEGVMIDPGLIVQTHLDIKSGIENPRTMKDFEGKMIDENIPGKFAFRLVADQSSSMAGEKAIMQRRTAIGAMEALKEFSDTLEEQRADIGIDLDVETELRGFGVAEGTRLYKPLSKELTEKQRIEFFKGLLETPGGTNDFDALSEIKKDIQAKIAKDSTYAAELKSGKRREIVVVMSDGESNNPAQVQEEAEALRKLGVKVVGLGMTEAGKPVIQTYAPDGKVCNNINDMPKALADVLADYLGDLEIE